ncbi:transcription factor MYB3R-5-like, partial [Rosa chinensis]|uniref:transcription factor MYB3R-5-like n=1 Tax=Rosa chinensis TaxID=74649 RepID=UPI000D087720
CRRITGPIRRAKGGWTPREDDTLRNNAVAKFKGKNWKKIAQYFPDISEVQCLHWWQKFLNPELYEASKPRSNSNNGFTCTWSSSR